MKKKTDFYALLLTQICISKEPWIFHWII